VLKQKGLDDSFEVKGVGIFVRSMGVLSLDMVLDSEKGEYQPLLVKHPVIRSYPTGWENKLFSYLQRDMRYEDLPNIAGHVDRDLNQDYRPPSWKELYLSATGFKGF
ncbi:hypothetical protein HC928_13515, partial [bacterium]|nr:hypothetical protein [bacterium]